jgi:hypothetical protein
MLFFMLDPKFKSLYLISSFIGHEQRVAIVEEYNERSLYPMLLKHYHHLHPRLDLKVNLLRKQWM